MIGSPLGKLHFAGWIMLTILNASMVLADDKATRTTLLLFVVLLQFATMFLFMMDYERQGSRQWKKRESKLREELAYS